MRPTHPARPLRPTHSRLLSGARTLTLLGGLLLGSALHSAHAQTKPPTAPTAAPATDPAAIVVAYPADGARVAFSHVLLEGSVLPGATLTIDGQPAEVGGDGLFILWHPLNVGENTLTLTSTLAGQVSTRTLRVTSAPPRPLTGAAQIVAASVQPAADRTAYLQPLTLEGRAVPVSFSGTPGAQASFRVGDLGPYPMTETTPGTYAGTFLLPERLNATPVTFTLNAPDGTAAQASSAGKLAVTGTGPRVAEVSADIPGRGLNAGTFVWRNGAGRNYVVYPRTGARTIVTGEDGATYAAQVAGSMTLNAPKSTLTLLPEGTPLPRAVFTRIDVKRTPTHSEIRLNLPARVPFTVQQTLTPGGSNLDLTLYHTVADVDYIVSAHPDPTVRGVTWAHEADNTARVHVDLSGAPWGYDATFEGTTLVLRVRQAPTLDPRQPLAGRTIVIDPGHGGAESGGAGALREPEKQIVLPIALRVAELLRERGARVILTRETDVTVPIYDRPLLAETVNADLLVSIHANALPDGVNPATARGSGVYYYHPQARALAGVLLDSLTRTLPDVGNDGVHYQNLALTRPTTQPSILIETAFLTDPGNLRVLMSGAGRERFAQAITLGLERYYRDAALAQPRTR